MESTIIVRISRINVLVNWKKEFIWTGKKRKKCNDIPRNGGFRAVDFQQKLQLNELTELLSIIISLTFSFPFNFKRISRFYLSFINGPVFFTQKLTNIDLKPPNYDLKTPKFWPNPKILTNKPLHFDLKTEHFKLIN